MPSLGTPFQGSLWRVELSELEGVGCALWTSPVLEMGKSNGQNNSVCTKWCYVYVRLMERYV